MIKQQFNALLTKEMDRKDFLKYSGGVLLAAVGVTGMIKMLLNQGGIALPNQAKPQDQLRSSAEGAYGYGGSAYGR